MTRRKLSLSSSALTAYFWAIILFLLFPVIVIIPISFGESQFLRFPPREIGLRWYRAYFSDPVWIDATLLSLKIGVFASIIATVTGTMAVLALERHLRAARATLTYVITSPIIIPHIFIALGVFILAVRFGFTNSEIALVGAHSMVAMPFVVLIVGASLRQIDPTIERAARVLGAGPIRAFFTATFPSLLPAIVAAAVFAFFVSFDELIIAQFLLSGKETLPMRIWADLQLDISPTVAAVASLLIVVTTVAMVTAELMRRRAARNLEN
jgi:ABC-type spermidine/putrescine transport system permease subunit II